MKDQKYRSLKAIMGAFETFNPNTKRQMNDRAHVARRRQRMTHRRRQERSVPLPLYKKNQNVCSTKTMRRANVSALALFDSISKFSHMNTILRSFVAESVCVLGTVRVSLPVSVCVCLCSVAAQYTVSVRAYA